ncbi:hypothetical protein AKO1_009972 [Acrasis kona]|uniref:Uncharacterized protein n=1 Tax=Acrasis kona TaxID=1008807 RepID=A0AAW2ZPA8_9EUKA
MSVLTVRLVRSFEYRNVKNMVLKNVDLENTTTEQLLDVVLKEIDANRAYLPHRGRKYDTIKIYYKAHQNKPNHLVINLGDDDTHILKPGLTLAAQGIEQETELSCFINEEYEAYKSNPENKW